MALMQSVTLSLVFLPFTLFIGLWVALNDMRAMKIPNRAVLALVAVWVLVGLGLVVSLSQGLPGMTLTDWGLGTALGIAVLVVLFIANMLNLMGAGDSKFGAAMAPFFLYADLRLWTGLLAASLLAAFVLHRILRAIPAMRRATPDWASWTHHKFPMGLALAGMLNFYLLIAPISSLLAGN
ncbi:prepilin peptidase [Rhodobacter sp. KR11]|uniref:prepilin peptidase n=1 Tax=Rhodobacter sp. KR11 TaxID=2974588 RepID=UPI00222133EA|nr:prepilin peptidase [Rhodobacter sp. KR11]MCW1917374.1 prepilin peptidase [Rhodobacter sp. KR11]